MGVLDHTDTISSRHNLYKGRCSELIISTFLEVTATLSTNRPAASTPHHGKCQDRTRDFSPTPAAPMEVKRKVLRRLGAPVRTSRPLVRIKTKETPARGTFGTERWNTFSWMKLEKCQNNL